MSMYKLKYGKQDCMVHLIRAVNKRYPSIVKYNLEQKYADFIQGCLGKAENLQAHEVIKLYLEQAGLFLYPIDQRASKSLKHFFEKNTEGELLFGKLKRHCDGWPDPVTLGLHHKMHASVPAIYVRSKEDKQYHGHQISPQDSSMIIPSQACESEFHEGGLYNIIAVDSSFHAAYRGFSIAKKHEALERVYSSTQLSQVDLGKIFGTSRSAIGSMLKTIRTKRIKRGEA